MGLEPEPMISLGIRDLGFQTICFIQRFSADEELGGSDTILSRSWRSDLECSSLAGEGAEVLLGWDLDLV